MNFYQIFKHWIPKVPELRVRNFQWHPQPPALAAALAFSSSVYPVRESMYMHYIAEISLACLVYITLARSQVAHACGCATSVYTRLCSSHDEINCVGVICVLLPQDISLAMSAHHAQMRLTESQIVHTRKAFDDEIASMQASFEAQLQQCEANHAEKVAAVAAELQASQFELAQTQAKVRTLELNVQELQDSAQLATDRTRADENIIHTLRQGVCHAL